MEFHPEGGERSSLRREWKQARVHDGRAHAALVYDGSDCVGWCQFGPTYQLPRIKRQRAYAAGATEPPDWRITCFFVDKDHRRRGVAAATLNVFEQHGFERQRPIGKHHWVVSKVIPASTAPASGGARDSPACRR